MRLVLSFLFTKIFVQKSTFDMGGKQIIPRLHSVRAHSTHVVYGRGETTSCPCLSSACQALSGMGSLWKWQDMPTNCITFGSVVEDNGPPYAEVGKWMELICAGTLSPHTPDPAGAEADTDRRAHPLPRHCAAVHHRIPQANNNNYIVVFDMESQPNRKSIFIQLHRYTFKL